LKPSTKVSVDESLNDVRRLRLSDVQSQRSWLKRITKPFPKDNKHQIQPETMEKQRKKYQIQAVLIEYLLQFIQKTALPTIQKYEQLKLKYSNDKKEWTQKAEFLERQNYWLKSELQNVNKSYRGAEEVFTDSQKIYSQRLGIDERGNFLSPIPEYDEIRRSLDFDLEALVIPDVKSYVSSEPDCTGETEEFTDFKPGYHRQANHVELKEVVSANESQINNKDFPNTKEKLEKSDKMNLQRKIEQESLQSTKKAENLKADNAPFESSGVNAQKEPHIAQSSSLTNDVGEWTGRKVSCETQDLCKSKVKTLRETEFIDPYILAVSDSWYFLNKNEAAGTLNSRVLRVRKERGVVCTKKICSKNTSQSPGFKNQYGMDNVISNNSLSRIAIRSIWI